MEKYDGQCSDKYIQDFCDYLEISSERFNEIITKYTNTNLFEIDGTSVRRKFRVGIGRNE